MILRLLRFLFQSFWIPSHIFRGHLTTSDTDKAFHLCGHFDVSDITDTDKPSHLCGHFDVYNTTDTDI